MMISHMYLYIREKSNIFRAIFILTLLGYVCTSPGLCLAKEAKEYEAKAALIYNLAKFVEWPDDTSNDILTLHVLGANPFGGALNSIKGKSIKGRTIQVKQVKSLQDIDECSMLFISSSENKNLDSLIKTIKGLRILTIGDTDGFANQGVIMNIYIEKRKLRFEINIDAAKESGLKLSSKLLNLARIVTYAPE